MIILSLSAALVVYLLCAGIRTYVSIQTSKRLIEAAVPYMRPGTDGRASLLVLGDSTAVGVGASHPDESLAGRVATTINASSVENYARSGAVTSELTGQIQKAKRSSYALILIQIGGNDIIRFKSAQSTAQELATALAALPQSERVIVISAGNVGGAPLLPLFLRPFYTQLNLKYHAAFAAVTAAAGYTYVNLYTAPGAKRIEEDPETYLAKDGLHPSSQGYALWFEAIRPALDVDKTSI